MGRREELIDQYAADLRDKCGTEPDMDLLTKVVMGLGPAIYETDASLVSSSSASEMERVKTNFLVGKLGLPDGPELAEAVEKVVDDYGRSEPRKHRAVIYYLLVKHFGRESAYA